jgi:3-methyl-2-oxobutanoate hydroxymethyltransferase
MRKTVLDISRAKQAPAPLVCLTAYTAPMAKLLDQHCDLLLVGDSVAMVIYGLPSTLQADMEMMIRHGRAVVDSTENAMVVVDMPFGTYQGHKEDAFNNAARILKETGATAVKCEGGIELAETVSYLTQRGIPVVGHIGLQPQSVNTLGGYKAQGRDDSSSTKIINDAKAIAEAGAFTFVIEGVAETLASEITKAVPCPTIGIGASVDCDGQILVTDDMLGIIQGKKPKFVKEYAALSLAIENAVQNYADDVRARRFPNADYTYAAKQAAPAPQPGPISVKIANPSTPASSDDASEKSGFVTSVLRAIPRRGNDER